MYFRVREAPGLFMVAIAPGDDTGFEQDDIVGYVCGTLTSAERLTHGAHTHYAMYKHNGKDPWSKTSENVTSFLADSMSNHEPEGSKLCIHSVCVDERLRRRGIALRSLIAYFDFVRCVPCSFPSRLDFWATAA